MRTLWHQTGPSIPTDKPHLPTPRDDVVVVGAGITGILTALLLVRAGKRVTVLEARQVGALTTGRTTGKLSLLQGSTLAELRDHTDDEVLAAYAEANREGQAWIARAFGDSPSIMRPSTAFTYATTEMGMSRIDNELDASHSAGIKVTKISQTPLPFETLGALQLDDQWEVHPMHLLAALTAELRERGGRVIEGCRVTGVDTGGESVQLDTGLGNARADRVVIATGTPILDRGLFFARLAPSRSFVATYCLAQGEIPTGMHLSVDEPGYSIRQILDPQGRPLLLVAGGAHPTGRGGNTAAILAKIDQWTRGHFGDAERTHWWAAQDYQDITRVPYAGALTGTHETVFTATGFNKWGLTNGVAAALSLSAQLLGGNIHWAQTMRDHHLSLTDAGAALSLGTAVGREFISGWGRVAQAHTTEGDLAEGEGHLVRTGPKPEAVARVDGTTCRLSAVCTHMGAIVNWNAAERTWDCPLHGSRFSATGELIEGPAVEDLPRIDE